MKMENQLVLFSILRSRILATRTVPYVTGRYLPYLLIFKLISKLTAFENCIPNIEFFNMYLRYLNFFE